ncbi:hypothetical protein [Streptomyces sp. LN549]|uniref:hypothetical protein n=1 Tax=Streptomyces sp. LN549 TaxID=3112979 RepID=UPI00371E8375
MARAGNDAAREFYTFDGRILEVFGSYPKRFHIRNMDLRVTGPCDAGASGEPATISTVRLPFRSALLAAGRENGPAAILGHTWHHSAEEWQRAQGLEALLEAVRAGIASAREHGAQGVSRNCG